MTFRTGPIIVIKPEPPRNCELCGRFEECRPYGPRGEQVCFDCGQKNLLAFEAHMNALFGRRQ